MEAVAAAAIGQAGGNLVAPAVDAGKGIYGCLKRKRDLVKNLHQYYEKLEIETDVLFGREQDVNERIGRNQVRMESTHECRAWLVHVGRVKQEFGELEIRYKTISNGSCGICGFCTRLKLSQDILGVTQSVVDLLGRMDLQYHLIVERRPVVVQKKYPKRINDVPLLSEHVNKLVEFLKDENIKRIGIFGMAGVGKTTIMETLNDEVMKHINFNIVIWVTVPEDGNIDNIQQKILERLKLDADNNESEAQRSFLISEALERQNYLLLLDQVVTDIKLDRVGIHESHANGKVVLATSCRTICDSMELDEQIKVERLSREDARKLFRGIVGEIVDHPHIKPIAELVLKQCGELPQVIKAVARHLKNSHTEDLWSCALEKLRLPNMSQVRDMEETFNVFRLVYDELAEDLKSCILYTAAFPEDHEIYQDYLIECWKAEQLIDRGETFRKARIHGRIMLDNLIERHLFDQCRSKKRVKMPIIFRNVALDIANQHNNFKLFVRDGNELEDYPSAEMWRSARVISMIGADLQSLPDRPECCMISTLFLQKNEELSAIPVSFFDCMSSLTILDLYGTGIKSLPLSVSKLTNLRGLYLNDCSELRMLPEEIGQLTNLESLDISRTGFCALPIVIRKLSSLRCLRASFAATALCNGNHTEDHSAELVSADTINTVLSLEELILEVDPRDSSWSTIATRVASEIAALRLLTALSFYFPTVECLDAFTGSSIPWNKRASEAKSNFRFFKILVGHYGANLRHQIDMTRLSAPRTVRYSAGVDTPYSIKEALKQAYAFELIGHQSVSSLSDFGIDEMRCLEVCTVQECSEMTSIVDDNLSANEAFQWLKELHLCKLPKFKGLCNVSLASRSFAQLTNLTFDDCGNMKTIFSKEIIEQLSQLQYLKVQACPGLTEIIGADIQSNDPLPKLRVFELVSLEALVSIHHSLSFNWLSLEKIEIVACDLLANLSLGAASAKNLHYIRCSEAWWRPLMQDANELKERLEQCCSFIEHE